MVDWLIKMVTADLTPQQARTLMAVSWRAIISFHMLYACGYLAALGIPLDGFAQKADVESLKDAVTLQARIGIVREIRLQTDVYCTTADISTKAAVRNTIDRLRDDYRILTKEVYPEPRC